MGGLLSVTTATPSASTSQEVDGAISEGERVRFGVHFLPCVPRQHQPHLPLAPRAAPRPSTLARRARTATLAHARGAMFALNGGAHIYSILVCAPFRAAAAAATVAAATPPPATPAPREAPREVPPDTPRVSEHEKNTPNTDDDDDAAMRSSSTSSIAPFDALPTDVLRRILAPLADWLLHLLSARAVCVTWRDAVDGEAALWRKLRLSDARLARKLTDAALATLARRARGGLTELDVSGCARVTPAALAALAATQPRLCELRASTLDASDGLTDEAQWWSLEQARAPIRAPTRARLAKKALPRPKPQSASQA
jgi:hypothetical protein